MEYESGDRVVVVVDSHLSRTGDLLEQARRGDVVAREALFGRYRRALARFLHARLPYSERVLLETEDLVQEVSALAFAGLHRFEYRGIGSFWRYLRRIGMNQVLKAARRGTRRPWTVGEPPEDLAFPPESGDSPIDCLLLKEDFAAFEVALDLVPERVREALLLRFELGIDFGTIAHECGFASADAARMAVCRAVARIARVMGRADAQA